MLRTLYLIHHTHTDIGYTEVQRRIRDRQVDFIRQALRIAERDRRFVWTCETFWAVEQFVREAADDETARFVAAVRSGQIGLSASYLNYSELLDSETHRDLTRRARAFAELHGLPLTSAMTADINGHALGFAQALCDHGVQNLFACVHTYHGMYPLGRNQRPFYWQLPNGGRLLVWNGDHYHVGNELGLVPGAFMTHMVNDSAAPGEDPLTIAERRLPAYWDYLQQHGYLFDFVPLMVSGLMTDNAPPAPALPAFIETWNQRHGGHIRIELTTLAGFFEVVRASGTDIPVHEGLWPDWWADLTGATPAAVQVFRAGQRQMAQYRRLIDLLPEAAAEIDHRRPAQAEVEDRLALFAEHTFGHSGSYTHPDHLLVTACSYRKSGYAAEAFEGSQALLDGAARRLGAPGFEAERPLRFRVINPDAAPYVGPLRLELDQFEAGNVEVRFEPEGTVPPSVPGFGAQNARTGAALPAQAFRAPRGVQVNTWLKLEAGGVCTLDVKYAATDAQRAFIKVTPNRGIDGARDLECGAAASEHALQTPFVRIAWQPEKGITTWTDAHTGQSLLDPAHPHGAFTPVYEISPESPRTPMGRNRKAENVVRSAGRFRRAASVEAGELFSTVVLEYELPGTRRCAVLLRAYHLHPFVEVELSLHKETSLDVESIYLSLPFAAGPAATLWIDTSVKPMRPWKDQLPGTLTDFFHVFDGFASVASDTAVAVAMPDTPLLQLGDLRFRPRLLAGADALEDEPMRPYAWLMNNFWETNANIDLAGFYRFRYLLTWGAHLADPDLAIEECRRLNRGPVVFRTR
jgi:hypothetical protein